MVLSQSSCFGSGDVDRAAYILSWLLHTHRWVSSYLCQKQMHCCSVYYLWKKRIAGLRRWDKIPLPELPCKSTRQHSPDPASGGLPAQTAAVCLCTPAAFTLNHLLLRLFSFLGSLVTFRDPINLRRFPCGNFKKPEEALHPNTTRISVQLPMLL